MKHIVMYSGGVGSWRAGMRLVHEYGIDPSDVTLLFADTKMEDEDLYRFLEEGAVAIGAELVKVAEGRDPWEVFFDKRFLGNSRIDPCSRILKREFLRKYIEEHYEPDAVEIHLGIDAMERHRFERAQRYWDPWTMRAPMCEEPIPKLGKRANREVLAEAGIAIPRLYTMGFAHNNCGGFCIKAGLKQFQLLLKEMPERYAFHEEREEALRQHLGKDVTVLKQTKDGETEYVTLRRFRERVEATGLTKQEEFDWGGCGCFSGEEDAL